MLRVRHKPSSGGWLLILALLAVGVIGWFYWQHTRPQKKNVRVTMAAAATKSAANNAVQASSTPVVPVAQTPTQLPNPAPVTTTVPAPAKPDPKPADVMLPISSSLGLTEFPRPVRDVFEAQVALARRAISPGCIDGAIGSQTRLALTTFQRLNHLPETGRLDTNMRPSLTLTAPALTNYVVTTNDLSRLQPIGKTWLAKSQQTALDYETELELVAEKSHAHPELIRKLNPGLNWTNIEAGTILQIPNVNYPVPIESAALVVIHLSGKNLEAFGEATNLLAHFPCSIAARVEKRPVGELHMVAVAPNPNYTFDPAVFPESPEAQAIGHKLILPPGPNNPVGVAWISLDRPGYGIHGTPIPEQVGRTESHGCFRLANWDAAYLLKLATIGTPVLVEP
jgi:lipoprotein-anchoring transpeptidase ErfK/SrfK